MTQTEINALIRPYILRQQAQKREAMLPWVLAYLMLGILCLCAVLSLLLILNF